MNEQKKKKKKKNMDNIFVSETFPLFFGFLFLFFLFLFFFFFFWTRKYIHMYTDLFSVKHFEREKKSER